MPDSSYSDFFLTEEVMIVMTTSSTGLGHIRVADALIDSLSPKIRVDIMGLSSPRIQFLHRITSTSLIGRMFMEFVQTNPIAESLLTNVYRHELRTKTKLVRRRLSELIQRRRPKPKVVVIVATHMSLAHQIAAIKKRLAKTLGIKIFLSVVVTDDSPQKLWAVYGADLITVPSRETKASLTKYLESIGKKIPKIEVVSYPLNLNLGIFLNDEEYKNRSLQVTENSDEPLRIVLPISGAATQLDYFKKLLLSLVEKSTTRISIVSRESKYTKAFLEWASRKPHIEVIAESLDRDVVDSYEKLLVQKVFSVEVTKPSEQAFKALLSPNQKGGVILLFSSPIGRQEYDNLKFLERNHLIPNMAENKLIVQLLQKRQAIPDGIIKKASKWRGIVLPDNPRAAASCIKALQKRGILEAMMRYKAHEVAPELASDGARKFWRVISRQLVN